MMTKQNLEKQIHDLRTEEFVCNNVQATSI